MKGKEQVYRKYIEMNLEENKNKYIEKRNQSKLAIREANIRSWGIWRTNKCEL